VIGFSCRVGGFGRRLVLEYDSDERLWIAATGDGDEGQAGERVRDAIAAATGDAPDAPWIVAVEDQVLADFDMPQRPQHPWW
jgi:hypothetical protein